MTWKNSRSPFSFLLVLALTAPLLRSQVTVPAELTLRRAKDLLMKHSPLVKAEELNAEAARGVLMDESRRPNPQFGVESAGVGSRPDAGTFLNNQEFSAGLSYTIETGDKRERRAEVARYGVEIAAADLESRIRVLSLELKQRYYQVVLMQREVELANEISEAFSQLVELTRTRYRNGEISGRELRRIEAEQYRFQEDVIAADVQLESAQDRLLALLGSDRFEAGFRAVDDFEPSFTPPPISQLRRISLGQRKDLEAQKKRIDRAGARIALEKSRSTPDLTLFGGYRRDFGHDGAVLGMSVPLLVFNRNQGNIASAGIRQEQESFRLRALEIRVLQEVQLALNELEANRRRLQTLSSQYLEKTRQARDISETAYRLGSVSLIEFLDAQRAYREASRLQNRALYDFEIRRARLEFAVGGSL